MKSALIVLLVWLAGMLFGCIFLITYSCSSKSEKNKDGTKTVTLCDANSDSLLIKYANEFKVKAIDLSKSISVDLNLFLTEIDSNCLRNQRNYRLFISTILLKLHHYHLQCCNQGYDLLSMMDGGAAIVIDEFKRMGGYHQKVNAEFLNSGKIVDFVEGDSLLYSKQILRDLLRKIELESKRISKGTF
jgi:hypothetical protein